MNKRWNTWKKIGVAMAASVALVLPLAACEGQLPTPTAATSSKAAPDLTEAQEKKIRTKILDTLAKADEARSADGYKAVMGGPQLEIRTSQVTIAQKSGSMNKYATIPKDIAQVVIPTDDGWPRSVFTITTTTEDQQSQRLLVLDQNSARENYKLVAMARLFDGVSMPKFEVPTSGSQMGTAKDEGLVVTPTEALTQYADVLQNGSNSKYASTFADDMLRQRIATLTSTVQEGIARNNGTQSQTFTAVPDQMWIMRTADGGDLVVGRIDSVWTRQAGDGRESQPASDDEKILYNSDQYTSTMKVTYVNVVALYVPQSGDGAQVTAVGADRQPVKVEAL
ncbi:hypothetical protein [Bifidobacterium felsineum]|uniref:DUF8094 domain-containing protein n=1 Tax=Bifidobacterium felsineum TaxID=2045440 RepID=A0A2M9HLT3_9BIFI|nr:hypothetical protein [Bifidobacterium felsineum]MBT1163997.1 hypothetical protein [Bifidobacterium felsineum]PJM77775.1 hypothetical protein CSQ86_01550 [Bifidobacterium felsineum]